jgi:hypothetical protein
MLTRISPQDCLSLKTELSSLLLSNRPPEDEDSILVTALGERRIGSLAESGSVLHGLHAVGASFRVDSQINLYFASEEDAGRFAEQEMLPSSVYDVPVVLHVMPPAVLTPPGTKEDIGALGLDPCSSNRRNRLRPIQGGISSGHFEISAGTLGAICRVTGLDDDVFALSNNHVFANVNIASRGDAILQPGPMDGGTTSDAIGVLHNFVPIKLGSRAKNEIDAALCRLARPDDVTFEVCSIGELGSAVEHEQGMAVKKHGRTTGLTQGIVADESYDALIGMDHEDPSVVARFVNQILINQAAAGVPFGLGGDSGSLVVSNDNEPVGLFFAGPEHGEYGIANPIDKVMDKLKISSFRA